MARRKKMTVDEYIKNRDDITAIAVVQSDMGFEIVLRLDGSWATEEMAKEQAKYVGKTLGIRVAN